MPLYDRSHPGFGPKGPLFPGSFLLALREAFARLNWQGNRWFGAAVECADAQGRTQVLGLDNLYRRVRPIERERWSDLLVDYLASLPSEPLDEQVATLGDVAERLLVRLGPPPLTRAGDPSLWYQPIVGKHVVATLVIDAPQSMSYVTETMLAESGQPADHWLALALTNLRARTPADCFTEVHAESGLLQAEVGDAYDTSRALILDELLPGHEADGFFVAVPGRDHLLVLPIDRTALRFLPWLRAVAARTFRTLPYPISPEVFWVRGGDWLLFPLELQGEQVRMQPPAEFREVFERLSDHEPPEDAGPRAD
jgi:hypothetical protein